MGDSVPDGNVSGDIQQIERVIKKEEVDYQVGILEENEAQPQSETQQQDKKKKLLSHRSRTGQRNHHDFERFQHEKTFGCSMTPGRLKAGKVRHGSSLS
jgi:hypothetical protein